MAEIIWSKQATRDYWENIDYLLLDWTEKEAINFINITEALLETIEQNPKVFKKFNYKKNIHTVPVTKEVNLFYQVKRNKVELLRFWNNYRDPKKLKV